MAIVFVPGPAAIKPYAPKSYRAKASGRAWSKACSHGKWWKRLAANSSALISSGAMSFAAHGRTATQE
ncbi:MAG TPA: hypothetical protein VFA61_09615 [Candidatus Udaeobacter sp.]|nr:hypothetical protein [Candidatus Udaeobacter sp.]